MQTMFRFPPLSQKGVLTIGLFNSKPDPHMVLGLSVSRVSWSLTVPLPCPPPPSTPLIIEEAGSFLWQCATFWSGLIAFSWCHLTGSAVPSIPRKMIMESGALSDPGSIFNFGVRCCITSCGLSYLVASLFLTLRWISGLRCCQPDPAIMSPIHLPPSCFSSHWEALPRCLISLGHTMIIF